jgi:hypothetical protein
MPQLDITSFLSQILFIYVIFLIFYGNIIHWVIPFISRSIKIKKKIKNIKVTYILNINLILFLLNFLNFFKINTNFLTYDKVFSYYKSNLIKITNLINVLNNLSPNTFFFKKYLNFTFNNNNKYFLK